MSEPAIPLPGRRRNWPLLIGSGLILCVAAIAAFGPQLAPRDPLEATTVLRVEGQWMSSPFPPLAVPGFPLGTDATGRDVWSNLLWAVRPTLITVVIVAVVRLTLGALIGITSGWSVGRLGRWLDTLIAGALAVPVLIVALAVVAVLNSPSDVWPFVIGLSLTGWAETARVIREETRMVKSQPYIEAARALGSSGYGIVLRHVRRHVMPVVWMLFAFELGRTLLATAALGFLGYYLGGEVWIPVADFVAGRFSGLPDLGLMLSTLSTDIFVGPWKMLAAGSMVFVTVLGFNLLGEGLRQRLDPERLGRRETRWSLAMERLTRWIEEGALYAGDWARGHPALVAASCVAIIAAAGGLAWWQSQASEQAHEEERGAAAAALPIPGEHLWATQRHDPYGTLQAHWPGPAHPRIDWTFEDPSGWAGGPAVSADETIYIASMDGALHALDRDGHEEWKTELSVTPVGSPALGADGSIYVADEEGGLTAVSPSGRVEWHLPAERKIEATAGPIVGADGAIYYTIAGQIRAVSPAGKQIWIAQARPTRTSMPPALSPDGQLVFLMEGPVQTSDGAKQEFTALKPRSQMYVGANGRLYYRFEHYPSEWHLAGSGPAVDYRIDWDARRGAFGIPVDAGVTFDGVLWLYYANEFEDSRLVWLDAARQVIEIARYPHRPGRLVAIDGDSVFYFCGRRRGAGGECLAWAAGSKEPSWQMPLPSGLTVSGAALAPGRLYVATEQGFLHAIGDAGP